VGFVWRTFYDFGETIGEENDLLNINWRRFLSYSETRVRYRQKIQRTLANFITATGRVNELKGLDKEKGTGWWVDNELSSTRSLKGESPATIRRRRRYEINICIYIITYVDSENEWVYNSHYSDSQK